MKGSTHYAVGAAVSSAALQCLYPDAQAGALLTSMALGALGGLIPDIDHPKSTISRKVKPVSMAVCTLFSHRGLFHAPLLYAVLWTVGRVMGAYLPLLYLWDALFFGAASHLFLDALTPGGIPLLYPLTKKRVHLLELHTGGIVDSGIGVAARVYIVFQLCLLLINAV